MSKLEFDPTDPNFPVDPYPTLDRLRAEAPIHYSEALRGWAVMTHAGVQQVMRESRMSADRITPFYAALPPSRKSEVQILVEYLGRWLVFRDPPDHTRLRALIARAFTPKALETIRPNVEGVVTLLLDRLETGGEIDLVQDFANPLPAYVIMDMLGVPRSMLPEMRGWSDDIKLFIGTARNTADKYAIARRGVVEMGAAFQSLIDQRRKTPTGDILSALVAARDAENGQLNDEELIATAILFLFAGHETTASLIAMASLAMMRDETVRQRFLALDQPAAVQVAIEEFLRFDGPTPAMMRIAMVDTELGAHKIKTGDRVWTFIGAANRDPAVFTSPATIDLARSPNPHVTFGFGTHFCLGAPLARMEALIALPRLHRRFPKMSLAAPPDRWNDGLSLRGPGSIRVTLAR